MRSDPISAAAIIILACVFAALLLWNLFPAPRSFPADPAGRAQAEAVPESAVPAAPTEAPADPADLARFFRRPQVKNELPATQVPAAEPEPPPATDRFKLLGTATGLDGAPRLYLKEIKGGKLRRIRLDGAEESGTSMLETAADCYVFQIEGEKFAVSRSRP